MIDPNYGQMRYYCVKIEIAKVVEYGSIFRILLLTRRQGQR